MEAVKTQTKASDTATGATAPTGQDTPKATVYIIQEEDLTTVLNALGELPWKQSNPIINFLRSKLRSANFTETPKNQADENIDKETPAE